MLSKLSLRGSLVMKCFDFLPTINTTSKLVTTLDHRTKYCCLNLKGVNVSPLFLFLWMKWK